MLMVSELGFYTSMLSKIREQMDSAKALAAKNATSSTSATSMAPVAPAPPPVVMTAQTAPGTFPGVQPTQFPSAQAAQFPGAQAFPVAFLPPETPWFKKPLVLGAIGAGVLVLGAGGYMLARR